MSSADEATIKRMQRQVRVYGSFFSQIFSNLRTTKISIGSSGASFQRCELIFAHDKAEESVSKAGRENDDEI